MTRLRQLDLQADLEALKRFSDEERARALDESRSIKLSDEHQKRLHAFERAKSVEEARALMKSLPLEASMALSLKGTLETARDPYHFSELANWLELETWAPKDALLLLAGVSPKGAAVDWTYENFVGVPIDNPRIRIASDLGAVYDTYMLPNRDDWDDDIRAVKDRLLDANQQLSDDKRAELEDKLRKLKSMRDDESLVRREQQLTHRSNILSVLSQRWYSGDHDAARRYSPEHFLGWAQARGFQPEWYEWAKSRGLIDDHDAVYRAPFFDPDASDYPVLLHIAVRAWEAVRNGKDGTPKQRIERFLVEKHPQLTPSTRSVIAQVVNWQRTGGRPRD